ncbi:hypothetical protein ACFL59_14515 [Planctomycetota bacterium]
MHRAPHTLFLTCAAVLGAALASCATPTYQQWQSDPFTVALDRSSYRPVTVRLEKLQLSFAVPRPWIQEDTFLKTFEELEQVRGQSGNWRREYADPVNEALPFERCALHILGGTPSGQDPAFATDHQVRAYVIDALPEAVKRTILERAKPALGELSPNPVEVEQGVGDAWRRVLLRCTVWNADVGTVIHLDFWLRELGGKTIVLVIACTEDWSAGRITDHIIHSFEAKLGE